MGEIVRRIKGEAFDSEVTLSPLPVVMDFYGDGCPPCEVVSPILEGLAMEYEGRVKFLKLNLDDEDRFSQGLVESLTLRSVPTVVFFNGRTVMDRVVGVVPKESFRQRIEGLVNRVRNPEDSPSSS